MLPLSKTSTTQAKLNSCKKDEYYQTIDYNVMHLRVVFRFHTSSAASPAKSNIVFLVLPKVKSRIVRHFQIISF